MASKIENPRANPQALAEKLERSGVFVIGLILTLLPIFFWVNTHDQFELPKLVLLRLLSCLGLGLYAAQLAYSPRWVFRRTPIDLPLLAWSLWLGFKTLNSVSPSVSWRGEYENFAGSLTQLNYSLLFFLVVQIVRNLKAAKALLLSLEATALSVGMYAVFQALKLDFMAWMANSVISQRYFATLGNPNFLGALMIMALALLASRAIWGRERPSERSLWLQGAYFLALPLLCLALYFNSDAGRNFHAAAFRANAESGALGTLICYALGLIVAVGLLRSGRRLATARLFQFLEALILFKALANTGTRGAFAGLLAVVAFLSLLAFGRLWKKQESLGLKSTKRFLNLLGASLGVLAVLGAASLALGPELRVRMAYTLRHPFHAFDESRMQIWKPALKIIEDFPLTGTGVDTFKTVFPQYAYSKFARYDGDNVASRMAHCEPLQILSTMGGIGLALWIWLLASWGLTWLRLWRAAQPQEDEKNVILAGLAGLAVAYLVQNLVSFGVSAISAPFFICLGLLGAAGAASEVALPRPKWAKGLLLSLLAPGLLLGIWAATATFRADLFYNFGSQVTDQLQVLEQATADQARSTANYALNELRMDMAKLSPEQGAEINIWYNNLAQADNSRIAGQEPNPVPYRQAAQALLLVLSADKQSQGVSLCPGEVKYHVYLALAYEELYKRSLRPELKSHWFDLACQEYAAGIALNPRNAYYHGNLGRIEALRANDGHPEYLAQAKQHYLEAVKLGPVTKLFYENLILLYAQYGDGESCFSLLQPLEAKDPWLASQLYLSCGTTFYQFANNFRALKQKEKADSLSTACDWALDKAAQLDPSNADVRYSQGVIAFYRGHKKMASDRFKQALAINPQHAPTLSFLKQAR